ncbi:hypothetical protein BDV19DRAFT_368010 [Aspergillus venezuelensis]
MQSHRYPHPQACTLHAAPSHVDVCNLSICESCYVARVPKHRLCTSMQYSDACALTSSTITSIGVVAIYTLCAGSRHPCPTSCYGMSLRAHTHFTNIQLETHMENGPRRHGSVRKAPSSPVGDVKVNSDRG